MYPTKLIPLNQVKVGDKIETIRQNGSYHSAQWFVKEVTGAFVTLALWTPDGKQEAFSTENAYAEIPLTEAEYHQRYQAEAERIISILSGPPFDGNKILPDAYKEMDNSWCDIDPWDMAHRLKEKRYELIGYFKLDTPKRSWLGLELDLGIVAKDLDTGDLCWCHYCSGWIEDMISCYQRKMNKGK